MASVALTRAPRDNRYSHTAGRLSYAATWRRVSYLLRGSLMDRLVSDLISRLLAFGSPPAATQASIATRSSPAIASIISGGAMTRSMTRSRTSLEGAACFCSHLARNPYPTSGISSRQGRLKHPLFQQLWQLDGDDGESRPRCPRRRRRSKPQWGGATGGVGARATADTTTRASHPWISPLEANDCPTAVRRRSRRRTHASA